MAVCYGLRVTTDLPLVTFADGRSWASVSVRVGEPELPIDPERLVRSDGALLVEVGADSMRLLSANGDCASVSLDDGIVLNERIASRSDIGSVLATLIMPRYLAMAGELMLHAAGIVTDAGVIAVLGASATGKSTVNRPSASATTDRGTTSLASRHTLTMELASVWPLSVIELVRTTPLLFGSEAGESPPKPPQ